MGITHTTVVVGANDATKEVSKTAWNDDHAVPSDGFELGTGGPTISSGTGSPEGVVTAPAGSIYLDTGGTLYIKASGSGDTGWRANLTT